MASIFDLISGQITSEAFKTLKDRWDIWKGELKDARFEKFYKTLVTSFVGSQKGLKKAQAKKFLNDETTYEWVLLYLYRFTDPDSTLQAAAKEELRRHSDLFNISDGGKYSAAQLVDFFLDELETELRRDANKALLPHFADIRADIAESTTELKSAIADSGEKIIAEIKEIGSSFQAQIAAEQEARKGRAVQIDESGEKLSVNQQTVYDSSAPLQPEPSLPLLHWTLEANDAAEHRYRAVISDESGEELLAHTFTLKPDDAYLLQANHFLENDGLKDYRAQITLDSDRTFTRRLGNYFYKLITGQSEALPKALGSNGRLKKGFQLLLTLDPRAELLWQAPWEYLHDGEEFIALSGKVRVARAPKGSDRLDLPAIAPPLKILVVLSNPAGPGEFDGERALSAIQEALDYSRRQGWVELDFLEDATFANFQRRLQSFKPHVVHYIGHGGKNPADKKDIKPPYSREPGETYLAFADDNGDTMPLYGIDLKRLLAGVSSLRLLVLSGCMTGQTAFADTFAGVGTALLTENLPALVVMQYSVLVDTAIQFAKVFYERVAEGESVSGALSQVRQVLSKGREHRADWGIPALYLRAPQVKLINPRAPRRRAESAGEQVNIGDLPLVAGFVGRTRELRQLREILQAAGKPFIYIWGLGGIGKTSLTAKLIEKLEQQKAIEGRLVIRCHQVEPTFAALAEKLGSFISLRGAGGHAEAGLALQDGRYDMDTRVALLNKTLKNRRYLMVFDNFESLFSEKTPQVGAIRESPLREFFQALFNYNWDSSFLFTCRYQWDFLMEEKGMNRYACGLPLNNALLLHLPGLTPAQTRMVMKNLPNLGKLNFTQQNAVIPLLLGHPHTIHIFDAYLKQYGVKKVLADEEITRRSKLHIFEQLGSYFLDGLWAQLNEKEKETLGLLSVFRSAIPVGATHGSPGDSPLRVDARALQTLLNYSLLQRQAGAEGESACQVHPVVAGYVESKLDRETLRLYHLQAVEFYVAQEAAKLPKFEGIDRWTPKQLAQLVGKAAQQGNTPIALALTETLLEIHHHLFAAGEFEGADALVSALWQFLSMIGRQEVVKVLLRQSIGSLEGPKKYVAKGNLATLLNREGQWQEALATYQECIEYYKSLGDEGKKNVAVGIGEQALIYQHRGEYHRAMELERRAMALYEEVENQDGIVRTHYRIAQLLHFMDRYEEALTAGEEVLTKARAIDNVQYEAACLHLLGTTLRKLNRPQDAFACFQESLAIKEKIGYRAGQANTLWEMGEMFRDTEQYDASIQHFQRAMEIDMKLQNPVGIANGLEAIGITFEQQGHFAEALEKYREALRLYKQYAHAEYWSRTERNIARVQGKM